jgi:hypothetical protein
MSNEPLVPTHTPLDPDDRITLPKHFSDRAPWAAGTDGQAWLLLLESGRYRLLSDEQVQGDSQLEPIRLLILEGKPVVASEPTQTKDLRDEAIVARLLPTTVALHKQSQRWRVSLPRGLKAFEPPDCDPKNFSILFSLEGYLEIWYTDVLKRATLLPLRHQQL